MYKFFNKKGHVFVSIFFRYTSLVVAIVFLVFMLLTLVAVVKSGAAGVWYYPLFWLLPIGIYLGNFGEKVEVDIADRKITRSYFGFFKKSYHLSNFDNFLRLNHFSMGLKNGTDVIMIFDVDGQKKRLLLFTRLSKQKNVDAIITELRQIIEIN